MKADCFRRFLTGLLERLRDDVVAVKPQIAYFEALGAPGLRSVRGDGRRGQESWATWSSPT